MFADGRVLEDLVVDINNSHLRNAQLVVGSVVEVILAVVDETVLGVVVNLLLLVAVAAAPGVDREAKKLVAFEEAEVALKVVVSQETKRYIFYLLPFIFIDIFCSSRSVSVLYGIFKFIPVTKTFDGSSARPSYSEVNSSSRGLRLVKGHHWSRLAEL
jgi:hypothetical protein